MANEDIKEELEKLGIDYPKSANRTQLEKLLAVAGDAEDGWQPVHWEGATRYVMARFTASDG